MSRNEGIDTSGSPSKIVSGIWKGASNRTQEYPGAIDNHHPAIRISEKEKILYSYFMVPPSPGWDISRGRPTTSCMSVLKTMCSMLTWTN